MKAEIYEAVLSDIIQGIYKQNEIITEKQLIAKYGVSKSPIRDALIELCKEGVLISHPRYGYEVVRINEKEILDVVDFRILIETGCFRVYAPTFTPEDIAELKEFTMKECCWNGTDELPALKHWENNMKFHLKLISYSGNDYCYHMLESSTGVLTVPMHSASGISGITGPGMWMSKAIFALSGAWRKADLTRQSRP